MILFDLIFNLFFSSFLKQTQKNFDPVEIGRQILTQVKKMLQSLIILMVGSIIFCMLIGHLITRTLDLLDQGGFYFSNSIILLLVLMVIDLAIIIYVLNKTIKEDENETAKNQQDQIPQGASPIESAIAALIIDFVKQRQETREKEVHEKSSES